MPKDEFDFEDPFELNGMAFLTQQDTTSAMAECFIEEFMRLGYGAKQILSLFRNPHYLGPNLALQKRGEPFIRDLFSEVLARWGKQVAWADSDARHCEEIQPAAGMVSRREEPKLAASAVELDSWAIDPMGIPIPKLKQ
jgi:hypothetical protein